VALKVRRDALQERLFANHIGQHAEDRGALRVLQAPVRNTTTISMRARRAGLARLD
jgi:hypothetical protein